jgi:DNA-binding NarL/FixJ family response regulator
MSISILLAEDHQIVREGTRQLLEQSVDMKVIGEAADGLEAVELAARIRPDVIVMDVRLPRLNGIEATRAITTRFPKIKVLILSAYDNDSYVFPLLEAGASGYLLKTASGAELAEAIRLVHSGQTALSPRISAKLVGRLGGRQPYQAEGMADGRAARRGARARQQGHRRRAGHQRPDGAGTFAQHLRQVGGWQPLRSGGACHPIRLDHPGGWQ